LSDAAREALQAAVGAGASDCDVCLVEEDRLEVEVRGGEVERLARARDRILSVRLFRGKRVATVSTSDLSPSGVRGLAVRARELADAAEADPCVGLPEQAAEDDPSLEVYCARTAAITPEEAIDSARAADTAACDQDPRIEPLGPATVRVRSREIRLLRSDGFDRGHRETSALLSCSPVAVDGDEKQRDAAYQIAPSVEALRPAAELGREAARRALQRLGARKIATCRTAVVYEPRTAITLLQHLADSLVGSAVDQKRSFLADRLGKTVAAPSIRVVDDGRRPAGARSRPFDGEGVPTRSTPVIDKGVLKSYLLDTYTARRLGLETTGNAQRAPRGGPEPGASNLFFEPGGEGADSILARTERGLLVTDVLGFGFNPVTGDYSRGVAGLWIEAGEVQHPVQEVTVAGNLLAMLPAVDAVGDDLVFFGPFGAPTLRFRELTVAGV
jgi:PmbA protein